MKLSSPDWRKMTDADRETVRQFVEAGLIKTLARANDVTVRTVTEWRRRMQLVHGGTR